MATIPTTTYTTVRKVYELLNYYTEVFSEAVGTGDGSETDFSFDNRRVVEYSEVVYVAGTAKVRDTNYTIDYDAGTIVFQAGSIPTAGQAVTADYWWSEVPSSVVGRFIVRAEDEVERNVGRVFSNNNSASEYLDGFASGDRSYFAYQQVNFVADAERYKTFDNSYRTDKTVILTNYPVLSVNGVSVDVKVDETYGESYGDANQAWGGANWVSQGFTPAGAASLVKVRVYLKYNTGTAADITVGIYADSANAPTGSALASGTISSFTDSSYAWRDVSLTVPLALTAATKYHIVLSAAGAGTSAYHWRVDSSSPSYAGGSLSTSANSGSAWTADTSKDAVFSTYTGDVVEATDYVLYRDQGVLIFTEASGLKNLKGIQNVFVSYTYGYASVPDIVEQITTKQAAVYLMEARTMGDPSKDLSTTMQNVAWYQKGIERHYDSLGRKLQLYLV